MRRAFLCSVVIGILSGCGPGPIADADIVGSYVHATEDFAPAAVLQVRADHTFELHCTGKSADFETGRWALADRDGRTSFVVTPKRVFKDPGDCIVFANGVRVRRDRDAIGIVPLAGAPFARVR